MLPYCVPLTYEYHSLYVVETYYNTGALTLFIVLDQHILCVRGTQYYDKVCYLDT